MSALAEMKAVLQEARTEAATLRIELAQAKETLFAAQQALIREGMERNRAIAENTPLAAALRSAADAIRYLGAELCAEHCEWAARGEHVAICKEASSACRSARVALVRAEPPAVTGTTSDKPGDAHAREREALREAALSFDNAARCLLAMETSTAPMGTALAIMAAGLRISSERASKALSSDHAPSPLPHAFLPAPFYPDRCDQRVEDDGKRRQCARPRGEHGG